ncbi:carbon-nitrogen hydrolase family protein [Paenibacillus oryzisoli]|uniref:CN hydrolase domain-containing protein n=1 Tax=Paenibacillus oryzisoli TaxID=1850517 RepID=A0A198AC18_9BACL|nr:carbon-nitrogen hydrolase family protein [Paenibacillus oryzisoli]OAS19044.1 hypothetical protein A8708_27345 [Paenibacillus oryzisoli]
MVNRIQMFDSTDWISWSPHEALAPEFIRDVWDEEPVLVMHANGTLEKYGKWISKITGINGRKTYEISVQYRGTDIEVNGLNCYVMLTWSDSDGVLLTRDYLDQTRELDDQWVNLHRTMAAPEGATAVEVELAFRWSTRGRIVWRRPSFIEKQSEGSRKIRVATTLINKFSGNRQDNLAAMGTILDQAGVERADVVCLSECVYEQGCEGRGYGLFGESIPGTLTNFLSDYARKYEYYIITSFFEMDGDVLYNTALLIDRAGHVAGKYRKTHVPLDEAEIGVTPGREYPVFDTDLGRIGMMICWDCYFPEVARILTLKGAEILFVPTQGNTLIQSLARAIDCGVHVVIAGMWGENPSRIIDPQGQIIAEISDQTQGIVMSEIDLAESYYQPWLSVGNASGEARVLFRQERRPDSYKYLFD